MLLAYCGLLGLTYWAFMNTPTGFIPSQDKGFLLVNVQLPDSSSVRGTSYLSSDLAVCTIGPPDGRVFAGGDGACTVTIANAGFLTQALVTVTTFAPAGLSFVAIPGFANAADVSGDTAYVAAGAGGLQVVNVTDRTQPAIVGDVEIAGNANDVHVSGTVAYVAAGSAGLYAVDVSDRSAPAVIGSVEPMGGGAVQPGPIPKLFWYSGSVSPTSP